MAQGDLLNAVMQSDIGSAASGGVAHQAVEPSVASEFSASASYAVGAFVMRNGILYICNTAHSGAWGTGSDFTALSLSGGLANYLASFGLGSAAKQYTSAFDLDNVGACEFGRWSRTSVPAHAPESNMAGNSITVYSSDAIQAQIAIIEPIMNSTTTPTLDPKLYIRYKYVQWSNWKLVQFTT